MNLIKKFFKSIQLYCSIEISIALAFGLGGKDTAKVIADNWATKRHNK